MAIKIIHDFPAIIPNYELFIVDLFGVIHDGVELYPKVFDNLKYIKEQKKHLVFLSNAPRRAIKAQKKLKELGIDENLYDFILTSGEHAFAHFKNLEQENPPLKYYYLGPEKDRDLLHDTNHIEVETTTEADIAITTGLDPDQQVNDMMPQIHDIKQSNLELFCINPDKYVHKQNGKSHICAGMIAKTYIELGGKVTYYGKPYISIYQKIFKKFSNISKEKILCIGDGMETDITGANNASLHSALITSGMHVKELNTNIGQLPDMEKVIKLSQTYQATPTFIAALF